MGVNEKGLAQCVRYLRRWTEKWGSGVPRGGAPVFSRRPDERVGGSVAGERAKQTRGFCVGEGLEGKDTHAHLRKPSC